MVGKYTKRIKKVRTFYLLIQVLILQLLLVSGAGADDFGDAPASYGDASAPINSSVRIGTSAPDSETVGSYDYRALSDGNEEDGAPKTSLGITQFPILIDTATSYTTPIRAGNWSGNPATLESWIDFNQNGTFDFSEKTTVAVPTGTTGDVTLNWPSLPIDIARGTTFIRLKLTSDVDGTGEVEDHVISIALAVPPESPLVSVVSGETVRSCQAIVFEDDFNDLSSDTFLAPNRPGFSTIRDWTTTGGGSDTYARVTAVPGSDKAIYLGNGSIRRISPSMTSLGGLSFDSDGRLTTVIDAIELRSGPDDITPGTTASGSATTSSWGPDEVVFSRTFTSTAGTTYRFYFTGIPEGEGGGSYADGMMRIDTPVGSAHFLAPGSNNGRVTYAIEFTATSASSTIAIANYGHISTNTSGYCNPQHADINDAPWCTVDGTASQGTNEVTIDDVYVVEALCSSDYSDAPANGSTAPDGSSTTAYGETSHDIVSGILLGSAIDSDSTTVTSVDATGDGSDDGVTLTATLNKGDSVSIPVVVNQLTASSGYLQAWIDWNGDGDFLDAGEQIASDLQYSGGVTGTISVPVSVPTSAITSQTFARFRWSTASGLNSRNSASDGEVEDYAITIKGQDFGDAPTDMSSIDASLTSTYGDASHLIDATVFLGSLIDEEGASQNSGLLAKGDDADGTDDDDGVTFPLAGTTPVLRVDEANTVTIQASVNGFLNAWIDWNQDGDWNDAGENIASNLSMVAGSNPLIITPATTAPHGATYARFRFSSVSVASPTPTGRVFDGEVEDYRVNLILPTPIDVCSSIIQNSGFESAPHPTGFFIIPEATVEGWGTIPDSPSSGTSYAQRNGIEIWKSGFSGVLSFEGTYFAELNAYVPGMLYQDVELTPGSSYTWSFAHRGRSGVDTISVFMGDPDNLLSQGSFSTGTTAWKVYGGIYTVPAGEYITRFGFQAVGAGGNGNFIDALKIPGGCDYGDAPDSYSTLSANNGAYHVANNLLYLGAQPGDSETDGQPSVSANADNTVAVADEDGVTTLGVLNDLDRTYSIDTVVTNQTGDTARLIAWIDFDGNGTFDPDETAIRTVPTGTVGSTVTMNWSAIPLDIQAGNSYVRLRLTTESINNREPGGVKANGEVEDYPITITSAGALVSGRVYIDANSSASIDTGEAGIGNTVVVIHDVFTKTCRSVETTGNGDYSFNGVEDGGYEVYQAHGETTPVPQNCGTTFANNPTGYQSTTDDILFVNVAGADETDQDFGEVAGSNSPDSGNTGVGIAFDPNHQSEVLPGNVAFYAHVFTTEAEGGVRFTTTDSGNSTVGWTNTLYQDSDCNGALNGAEGNTPIEGINLGMAADSRLCIINKVFAPANVPALDQYQVTTAATFSFAGSTVAPSVLEVTDLTIAGQNTTPSGSTPTLETGASRLVLRKTVENLTQLSAETDTLNQANPGDFLKYRLYYRNAGSGPITDLNIDDVVPSYTGLVNGSNVCDVTPSGMACTPNLNIDELSWDFIGSLVGGADGHVSYEVVVDN